MSRWTLLLLLFWMATVAGAGGEPAPEPTNAAAEAARTVRVEASAPLPVGGSREMAREAALLLAWEKLAREALEGALLRIDSSNPRFTELAWILSARVVREEDVGGAVRVVLESPPMGDLQGDPALERSLSRDLDGDGRAETVASGSDGRAYVLQGERVVGSTAGLNWLLADAGRVRLGRVVAVESAEPAGPGRARLVVRLAVAEAVAGRYAGKATERREVLVSLAPPDGGPSVDLADPGAEAGSPVPLRGRVLAPAGLEEVRLALNGRELWKSPAGFRGRELQLDLVLELQPGQNEAVVTVVDREGRREEKRLRLHGPPPEAASRGRAVVVGVDRYAAPGLPALEWAEEDAAAVAAALRRAGFEVRLLAGAEATGAALREALAGMAGEPRGVLYFAGLSSVGVAAEGKLLLPCDSAGPEDGLSAAEIARSLPAGRVAVVLDTAAPPGASVDARWLEGSDFLAALAGPGRTLLASGDPSPRGREADGAGVLTAGLLRAGSVPWLEAYRAAVPAVVKRLESLEEAPGMPLLRGDTGATSPVATASPGSGGDAPGSPRSSR